MEETEPQTIPLLGAYLWVVAGFETRDGVPATERLGLMPEQQVPRGYPPSIPATGPLLARKFASVDIETLGVRIRVPNAPDGGQLADLWEDHRGAHDEASMAERRACRADAFLTSVLRKGLVRAWADARIIRTDPVPAGGLAGTEWVELPPEPEERAGDEDPPRRIGLPLGRIPVPSELWQDNGVDYEKSSVCPLWEWKGTGRVYQHSGRVELRRVAVDISALKDLIPIIYIPKCELSAETFAALDALSKAARAAGAKSGGSVRRLERVLVPYADIAIVESDRSAMPSESQILEVALEGARRAEEEAARPAPPNTEGSKGAHQPRPRAVLVSEAADGQEMWKLRWNDELYPIQFGRSREALSRGLQSIKLLLQHPGERISYFLLEGLARNPGHTRQNNADKIALRNGLNMGISPIGAKAVSGSISISEAHSQVHAVLQAHATLWAEFQHEAQVLLQPEGGPEGAIVRQSVEGGKIRDKVTKSLEAAYKAIGNCNSMTGGDAAKDLRRAIDRGTYLFRFDPGKSMADWSDGAKPAPPATDRPNATGNGSSMSARMYARFQHEDF